MYVADNIQLPFYFACNKYQYCHKKSWKFIIEDWPNLM